jgi:miniconductance mechanosensitive channel
MNFLMSVMSSWEQVRGYLDGGHRWFERSGNDPVGGKNKLSKDGLTMWTWIESWLTAFNTGTESSGMLTRIILAAAALLLSFITFYVIRRIVRSVVHGLFEHSQVTWDDRLRKNKLIMRMTLVLPALIIHLFIPAVFGGYDRAMAAAKAALNIYFIFVVVLVVDALINSALDIYNTFRVSRDIPLKGFSQVLKIFLYGTGLILMISVILGRSPVFLISGLGAMTAILMLVFKDPILGFAGGIQLISNRMLKNGDWIEMPKFGADGDVLDITLTTVKVRNWDNTITTIPTYALINDSFKNWRGMQESQGRRIKRAIYIDMSTIAFCTHEMLERFSRISTIADYMQQKKNEIERHNEQLGDPDQDGVDARRLTNIGTFRAYADAYLENHPMINTEMTHMVRQLAPTQHGLPLEVYAFCRDKAWVSYESVQADIFDHLLAVAGEFGLTIYQYPAGSDIQKLSPHRVSSDR